MSSSSQEQARHVARRTFLEVGGLSALGLGASSLARAAVPSAIPAQPRAKSAILLYMIGGPAQHETFDVKPDAPEEIRGEFSPIATSVPGTQICEHLPELARRADRYAIIRSVHHDATFHGAGVHYNLTGWKHAPRGGQPMLDRRDPPSIGGVVQQLDRGRSGLPAAVQLPMWITQDGPGNEWAGQHAGFLGSQYDPLMMDFKGSPPGTLPGDFVPGKANVGRRFQQRVELLERLGGPKAHPAVPEGQHWKSVQQEALAVLRSSPKWQAFCIDQETPQTRERYGDHHFGRSCLVARRLVEAGVRLVTVAWPITKSTPHFDTHANHFPSMKDQLLPPMDQGISALLDDLQQRGLLDATLVVCTGEFGRTPRVNPNGGRDHWGPVYSTLFAGGGTHGGLVYGSSDTLGAHPKDRPVPVADFVASIYHAIGFGRETKVVDFNGRSHYIVGGRPVAALFA